MKNPSMILPGQPPNLQMLLNACNRETLTIRSHRTDPFKDKQCDLFNFNSVTLLY